MSTNIGQVTLKTSQLNQINNNPTTDKTIEITSTLAEKNLQAAASNGTPINLALKINSKKSENTQPLDQNQKLALFKLLRKFYDVPGGNGAPNLRLYLLKFLEDLYRHLPYVNISLIGSAVGNIIDPQSGEYNDIDFLIQVDIKIKNQKSYTKEFLNSLIKEEINLQSSNILNAIEYCLSAQSKKPINSKEFSDGRLLQEALKEIGQNYLSTQFFINSDINWNQLSASGNRCSILSFGKLEFKTTFNICIEEEEGTTSILGLTHASAFDRDAFNIPLSLQFFNSINDASPSPVHVCSSDDASLEKSLRELKAKVLDTPRPHPSKCLKGMDNTTCKRCFYSNTTVNHSIYTQFLEMPEATSKLKTHYQKQAKTPLRAICALLNFFMNGANLEVNPALIQPFHECIYPFLNFFKTDQEIPQELLLKWCHLMLILSSTPTSHTDQLLSLNLDQQTYYLLKPNDPLTLLQDIANLLKQYPSISLKDLPVISEEFKTMEQLFLKIRPLLKNESSVTSNRFLLLNCPSLLKDTETLNFDMLTLLLNSLSTTTCPEKRRELIEKTEGFFEGRGLKIPAFFQHLHTFTIQDSPTTSSLVLLCIQQLASSKSTQAHTFWKYAQKQHIFATSIKDEIAAFSCIQELQLKKYMTADELNNALKNTTDLINKLTEKQVSENIETLNLLTTSIILLLHKLSDTNCSQKEVNALLKLHKIATEKKALSDATKSEIKEAILYLIIKFDKNSKLNPNKKNQTEPLLFIKEAFKDSSDSEFTQKVMDKLVWHLYTKPNGPTMAKKFIKDPLFIPTLFKTMKKGSLKDASVWFTFLCSENFLKYNDERSWECCKILLAQWLQTPDPLYFKQMLHALNFLKEALQNDKGKSPILKEQASSAYTNFVHGCVKNPDKKLLGEAEHLLHGGIKHALPSDTAILLSVLILAQPSLSDAIVCLNKAMDKNIFPEDTYDALIRTYSSLTSKLILEQSKELTSFIEATLGNHSLMTIILKNSKMSNADNLILLLLSKSNFVQSPVAVENLVKLLKKLYENRKTITDNSFDEVICSCTYVLFNCPALQKHFNLEQWMKLIDIVKDDSIPFKNALNEFPLEDIFMPFLTIRSSNALEKLNRTCKTTKEKKQALIFLNSLKKYDNSQIENENYVRFRLSLMKSLMHLGEFADAQTYLKNSDPHLSLVTIAEAISTLMDLSATHILCSKDSQISQSILEGLSNVYSKQFSDQTIAQDDIKSFKWYHSCILLLLSPTSETPSLFPDFHQKLTIHLERLIKCMQNHPEVLEANGAEYYTNLLNLLSNHPNFQKLAQPLFDYAKQKNLFTDQEAMNRLEAMIKMGSIFQSLESKK